MSPADFLKGIRCSEIVGPIGGDLFQPKIGPATRNPEQMAVMSMPETSADEYRNLMSCQHDIGRAREFPIMDTESKTSSMKRFAHEDFRLCIFPSNAAHHAGAGGGINYVTHNVMSGGEQHSLIDLFFQG